MLHTNKQKIIFKIQLHTQVNFEDPKDHLNLVGDKLFRRVQLNLMYSINNLMYGINNLMYYQAYSYFTEFVSPATYILIITVFDIMNFKSCFKKN